MLIIIIEYQILLFSYLFKITHFLIMLSIPSTRVEFLSALLSGGIFPGIFPRNLPGFPLEIFSGIPFTVPCGIFPGFLYRIIPKFLPVFFPAILTRTHSGVSPDILLGTFLGLSLSILTGLPSTILFGISPVVFQLISFGISSKSPSRIFSGVPSRV